MIIKKGDTVIIDNSIIGFVLSGSGVDTFTIVFFDKEESVLKQYARFKIGGTKTVALADSSLMCKELKDCFDDIFTSLKKGQFVEFTDYYGKSQKGYVEKGGCKPTVFYSGGEYQVTQKASLFTVIESIVEKEPESEMDKWAIVGFKHNINRSIDNVCFETFVTYEGKKVLFAESDGKGNPTYVRPASKTSTDLSMVEKFKKDLSGWIVLNGFNSPFDMEHESCWIEWLAFDQKLGITAKSYLTKSLKEYRDYWASFTYGGTVKPDFKTPV